MARRGRPPLGDHAAVTFVVCKVTPRMRLELAAVARATGTTMSAVIRDAVNTFVADYGGPPIFPTDPRYRRPPKYPPNANSHRHRRTGRTIFPLF